MEAKSVLLVENEPVIAVLTRMELENLGYEVEVAATGLEAIEIAQKLRPDVVLMDFQLDGDLDGAQTAREIGMRFEIPVIFLTGSTDINNIQKCLATRPYGFLKKPCSSRDLQKAIERALFVRILGQSSKPFAA